MPLLLPGTSHCYAEVRAGTSYCSSGASRASKLAPIVTAHFVFKCLWRTGCRLQEERSIASFCLACWWVTGLYPLLLGAQAIVQLQDFFQGLNTPRGNGLRWEMSLYFSAQAQRLSLRFLQQQPELSPLKGSSCR